MISHKLKLALPVSLALVLSVLGQPAFAAPPANDDWSNRNVIDSYPRTVNLSTVDATTAPADPTPRCGNNNRARSVWYSFTPSADVRLEANTVGSNYDTIASVWTGSTQSGFSSVACNDDSSDVQSRVYFNAAANEEYSIMVSSYGDEGGNLTLRLREAPADLLLDVVVDDFGWTNAISGRTGITGEITCSQESTVTLDWRLTQRQGARTVEGYGYEEIECDGNERFLDFADGSFKQGQAGVDLEATVPDPAVEGEVVSKTITLRSCTQIGTLGADNLQGSASRDLLCGLAGNDILDGDKNNDVLRAFDGNDVGRGRRGDDLLTGGYGRDRLSGDRGKDTLYGDAGRDVLDGGPGFDVCYGGGGRDVFRSCEKKHR